MRLFLLRRNTGANFASAVEFHQSFVNSEVGSKFPEHMRPVGLKLAEYM